MDLVLSESGYDYSMDTAYNSYLENRIEQEIRINTLISECSILNEANTSIVSKTRRIAALHEAGTGDKIKAKLNKMFEFVKNLFGKFMVNVSKIINNEKDFLEKYKDVILNKKGSSELKISYLGDYDIGMQRINDAMIPQFDYDGMKDALAESDEDVRYSKFFNIGTVSGVIQGFKYEKGGDNLPAQLKGYFIAADKGQKECTMEDIKLRNLYNFCGEIDHIKNITTKDQNTVRKYIDDIISKTSSMVDDTVQNTNAAQEAGAVLTGRYLREEDGDTSSKVNASSIQTQDDKTKDDNANTAAKTASMQIVDTSKDDEGNVNKDDVSKNKDAFIKVCDEYVKICQTIIAAKCTGAEQIVTDGMKMLAQHVKSYVGKDWKKDETRDAQQYKTKNDEQPKEQPKEGEAKPEPKGSEGGG